MSNTEAFSILKRYLKVKNKISSKEIWISALNQTCTQWQPYILLGSTPSTKLFYKFKKEFEAETAKLFGHNPPTENNVTLAADEKRE